MPRSRPERYLVTHRGISAPVRQWLRHKLLREQANGQNLIKLFDDSVVSPEADDFADGVDLLDQSVSQVVLG